MILNVVSADSHLCSSQDHSLPTQGSESSDPSIDPDSKLTDGSGC